MPRVNLNRPEVEPLKGIILERQKALKYSNVDMAQRMGMSRNTYSSMINSSMDTWSLQHIKKACLVLGIPKDTLRASI